MIISESAADMNRGDVIEIERRGSQYWGLQLEDFAETITPATTWFKIFKPTILCDTPLVVPSDYMGLNVENYGNGTGSSPKPSVTYGIHRLLGFGTYWPEIETADNVYNWTKMDAAVNLALRDGKNIMWNVCYVPTFHSSNLAAKRSSGPGVSSGWPAAPADLAGSMQTYPAENSAKWARFVRAAVQRYKGKIKYWVMWNEPNFRTYSQQRLAQAPCGNWFDTSDTGVLTDLVTPRTSVTGNQNYTQFVQLQADFYGIIKAEDPSAVVIGCDMFGEASSQAQGGKQDGKTCFAAWLAAGGATYCDAYGYHGYMDEFVGIEGVSKRWNSEINALESARIAAGAPEKPWYNTETGHEALVWLPLSDQQKWLARNAVICAARGWKCFVMYVWDSLNPATTQMSLWAPESVDPPGVRPIANYFSWLSNLLQGATIQNACLLNNGKVVAKISGEVYVF